MKEPTQHVLQRTNLTLLAFVIVELMILTAHVDVVDPTKASTAARQEGIVSKLFADQLGFTQRGRTSYVAFSDSGDQVMIVDTTDEGLTITFTDSTIETLGDLSPRQAGKLMKAILMRQMRMLYDDLDSCKARARRSQDEDGESWQIDPTVRVRFTKPRP